MGKKNKEKKFFWARYLNFDEKSIFSTLSKKGQRKKFFLFQIIKIIYK